LQLKNISKVYPSVVANDQINLVIEPGEIHAVLGENGAGKSTLMKMIYGVSQPTVGDIFWQGKQVSIPNPATARKMGIGMVFQHFALFETLTVVENVALALEASEFNLSVLANKIEEVSERYGLPINPYQSVHSLSVGERQRVEIVRCLLQDPKLLIMDEPTSVLTPQAVQTLFKTLRKLSSEGCAILYISHKLDEIQTLCHSAMVLRHGKVTGHANPQQETASSLAQMMIGQALPEVKKAQKTFTEVRLSVDGLTTKSASQFETALSNINLKVHGGEIVGIAGVSGNGQNELVKYISGELTGSSQANNVVIMDTPVDGKNCAQRRELGLVFVPEERLGRGAVPVLDLKYNALLTGYSKNMLTGGAIKWIKPKKLQEFTDSCIEDNDVRCGGRDAIAKSLSGGNLQKFIVGRELALSPKVVLVSQPTWGVDVGAASFIRQELIDLASTGAAVLVISEEIEELFEICDTLYVISEGQLSPATAATDTTVSEIGLWMAGMWPDGPATLATNDNTAAQAQGV
jgi:simple sugar transport system ATP-binding protein